MNEVFCDRCGCNCTNEYWYIGRMNYCPSCHEYNDMVKKGLGTVFTIPETCEGCSAKLPYSGICEYCGRNNRKLISK